MWKTHASCVSRALGSFAVTYTAYSRAGPLVALAMTDDFRTFERHGPDHVARR